jgi:peroxin-5
MGQVQVQGPTFVPAAPVVHVDRTSFLSPFSSLLPSIPWHTELTKVYSTESLWDREFQSQEQSLAASQSESQSHTTSVLPQTSTQAPIQAQAPPHAQDDLARTAGLLVQSVSHDTSPKFQNSAFMGLMRQLRDGAVVVDGNQMIEVADASSSLSGTATAASTTNRPLTSEVLVGKGKARVVDEAYTSGHVEEGAHTAADVRALLQTQSEVAKGVTEDANEAYFQRENEEFAGYWDAFHNKPAEGVGVGVSSEERAWDQLQDDWERFEASTVGIRAVDDYRFQPNNPYLLGDSSGVRVREREGQVTPFYEVCVYFYYRMRRRV